MAFLPTNAAQVQQFAAAMYGIQVGTTTMTQVNADINNAGSLSSALNSYYAVSFGSATTAAVAASVAANLGLTGTLATDGATYIKGQLDAAPATARGVVISNILNLFSTLSADATFGAAATAWNTKVESAVTYSGATDVVAGSTLARGNVFTLLTTPDAVVGTANPDTVVGVLHSTAASGTLAVGDTIDLGAGIDTASITLTGTTPGLSVSTSPVIRNAEIISLNPVVAASSATLNVVPQATTLIVNAPAGTFGVTATPLTVLDVAVNNTYTDDADQTYAWASGLAGSSDALTLRVDGLSAATLTTAAAYPVVTLSGSTTGQGFETVNVIATGANSRVVDLIVNDGTTNTMKVLNVSGDKSFRINTALVEATTTINASANTGGVNVGTASSLDVTFTGGSGNDRIAMGTTLAITDKLDGGTGTDTLAISQATSFSSATSDLVKAIKAQTGFERLEHTNVDVGSITLSALSTIDYFTFTGAQTGKLTINGSKNTNTIEFGADSGISAAAAGTTGAAGADAIQILTSLDGGSNAINIVLTGGIDLVGQVGGAVSGTASAAAGGIGGDAIDVATLEVINIESKGTTANTLVGGDAGSGGTTAADTGTAGQGLLVGTNATVNITGTRDLTIESIVGANTTVNASTFTGNLTVVMNDISGVSNDVITGGAGNDTISGGDGRDAIDLTAGGIDTVVLAANTVSKTSGANTAAIIAAADRDTITGFTAGSSGDKLDVTGTVTMAQFTAAATTYTIDADKLITEFTFNASLNSADLSTVSDGTELLKGIGSAGALSSLVATASDTGYLIAYANGNAYLYYYAEADTAATLEADEIALIAVLNGVAVDGLVVSNFV